MLVCTLLFLFLEIQHISPMFCNAIMLNRIWSPRLILLRFQMYSLKDYLLCALHCSWRAWQRIIFGAEHSLLKFCDAISSTTFYKLMILRVRRCFWTGLSSVHWECSLCLISLPNLEHWLVSFQILSCGCNLFGWILSTSKSMIRVVWLD